MAGATELPELVREFTDMSKEYLLQETVEPAKQLGRYGGYAFGAGLSFAIAAIFLSIAGLRGITALLPDGPNWQALAYGLAAIGLAIIAMIVIGLTAGSTSTGDEDGD
jgi:hypothetical protein